MSCKKPEPETIEVTLEFVNTQIGFLIGCISGRREKGENTNDLSHLLESMRKLKTGLETGKWDGVII
jgi:hypothetical protein